MSVPDNHLIYRLRLIDSQGNEAFFNFKVRWYWNDCSFTSGFSVSNQVYTIGAGMTEKTMDYFSNSYNQSWYYCNSKWTLTMADGSPVNPDIFYWDYV